MAHLLMSLHLSVRTISQSFIKTTLLFLFLRSLTLFILIFFFCFFFRILNAFYAVLFFFLLPFTGWALTCPVCLSFMVRIAWPEASKRAQLALIMILEAVLLLGMVSGMSNNLSIKITLYVISAVLYIFMVSVLAHGMFYSKMANTRSSENKSIFVLFMTSWLIFPVCWLLGPNMTGILDYRTVLVFFAFGDIFAKNIFSYVGFKVSL